MTNTFATPARTALSWRDFAFMAVGAILLAAASQFEVPFYPVPMTLQTVVVLALGLALGWRRALGAVAGFLAMGASGLPVFAGGAAGPLVLLGPTGGYLAGFVLAAVFCGLAADRGLTRNVLGGTAIALLGAAIIYVPGLLQLGTVIGWDKPVLSLGLYPFILGDIVKALLAALTTAAAFRSFGAKG